MNAKLRWGGDKETAMPVTGIDHINIIADDLDETAQFYAQLLGLGIAPNPQAAAGFDGRWLLDGRGHPIIHLMARHPDRHAGRIYGAAVGSIDHIALACDDFVAMQKHCAAIGVEHRVNDRKYADLRQIFVTDPNGVSLELNFAPD